MEIEDQEGEALLNQEEEQPVDSMEPLVCGEGLFSDSQLVEMVNNLTPDPVCPARNVETEKALQPGDISWECQGARHSPP